MQRDAVELIEQALRLSVRRGMPDDSITHTFGKILRRVRQSERDLATNVRDLGEMSPEQMLYLQSQGLVMKDEH